MRRLLALASLGLLLVALAAPVVAAQEKYPNRPIDFIVPWGTGGGAGVIVLVWPLRSVIVTVFVVLLITTVLWMLTKITLLGGGAT